MNVAVVGQGKLGLCLSVLLAESGHDVLALDVDRARVDQLRSGVCPIVEPGVEAMLRRHRARLEFSTDIESAAAAEMTFVVVPTPSDDSGRFDPSAVVDVARRVGRGLRDHQGRHTFVVVSTVMPGDTEAVIAPALREAAGWDVGCVVSPEFIALGTVLADMRRPDLILIGTDDPASGIMVEKVLDTIDSGYRWGDAGPCDCDLPGGCVHARSISSPVVKHLSLTEAEIAKIAVNAYVTGKISWANTLGELCRGYGARSPVVAAAIGVDSRIGPRFLRPGGAYGGECFPRDQRAFIEACQAVGVDAPLSVAADQVNSDQAWSWAVRVVNVLGPDDKVTVLGTSYKPGTDVTTEAFSHAVTDWLRYQWSRKVTTHDPIAACDEPDLEVALADADVVFVATDDPRWVRPFPGKVVVDPWGLPIPTADIKEYIGP